MAGPANDDDGVPARRLWRVQISLGALLMLVLGFGLGLAVNQFYRGEEKRLPNPNNIRLGDTLTIEGNLAGRGRETRTVTVLGDGTITLPRLAQVPAAGLSLDGLTQDLNKRYLTEYGKGLSAEVFVSFAGTSTRERETVPNK